MKTTVEINKLHIFTYGYLVLADTFYFFFTLLRKNRYVIKHVYVSLCFNFG